MTEESDIQRIKIDIQNDTNMQEYAINNITYIYVSSCFLLSSFINCHHFATDHLQEYVQFTNIPSVGVKGTSSVL